MEENDVVGIFSSICGTRKRHDDIIRKAEREAKRVSPHMPLKTFSEIITRKLRENENLIIGPHTLASLGETDLVEGFKSLNAVFQSAPKIRALKTWPVLSKTGGTILLIVSHYAFRASEIAYDIWKWQNPEATDEEKYRSQSVTNAVKVAENLSKMGVGYGRTEVVDCLLLISQENTFFLRALFLYKGLIEPKPFIEMLEAKGFQVAAVLDEELSEDSNPEYDFLKRLQGLLIAKSEESMETAQSYTDFIIDLSRFATVPEGRLTDTGQASKLNEAGSSSEKGTPQ